MSSNKQLSQEMKLRGEFYQAAKNRVVGLWSHSHQIYFTCLFCIRDSILDSILSVRGPESLLILSKHKYASNVVEKLIQFGSVKQREIIVAESLKVSSGVVDFDLTYTAFYLS
jgi:hypothetical protein